MIIKRKDYIMITNYEIFKNTIQNLSTSQGFYTRLYNDFLNWSDEEKQNAEKVLNDLPKWKDNVDCVLFLEQ